MLLSIINSNQALGKQEPVRTAKAVALRLWRLYLSDNELIPFKKGLNGITAMQGLAMYPFTVYDAFFQALSACYSSSM